MFRLTPDWAVAGMTFEMDTSFEEFVLEDDPGFFLPAAEKQTSLDHHPALGADGGDVAASPFGVFGAPEPGPENPFLAFAGPEEFESPSFLDAGASPLPAPGAPEFDFFNPIANAESEGPVPEPIPLQQLSPASESNSPAFVDFLSSDSPLSVAADDAPPPVQWTEPPSPPIEWVEPPPPPRELPVSPQTETRLPMGPADAHVGALSRAEGDALRDEVAALRSALEAQTHAADLRFEAQDSMAREMARLKALYAELGGLVEGEQTTSQSQIAALQAENQDLRQHVQSLLTGLETLRTEQQPLMRAFNSLHAQMTQWAQSTASLTTETQALKKGLHVLHSIQRAVRQTFEKVEGDIRALQHLGETLQAEMARTQSALKLTRASLVRVRGEGEVPHAKGHVNRIEFATTPGTLTSIHLSAPLRFDRDRHDVMVWRRNGDVERLWALAGEEDLFRWRCPLDPDDSPPVAVGLVQDGLCVGAWWSPEWVQGLPRLLENGPEEAFLLLRWLELPVADPETDEEMTRLLQAHPEAALVAWKPGVVEWPSLGARMEPCAWLDVVAPLLASLVLEATVVENVLHRLALDEIDWAPENRTDWLPVFERFDALLAEKMRIAVGLEIAEPARKSL